MSKDQGGFRKGRGCADQIFAMKRLVEGYLGKDKKLYAAFMAYKYNRVDREALWSVLRIYGVGGQLLKGIQAFYSEANACVRVCAWTAAFTPCSRVDMVLQVFHELLLLTSSTLTTLYFVNFSNKNFIYIVHL